MYVFLLERYQRAVELTYHTFEIYHLSALNRLFDEEFNARDIQMLSLIKHAQTPMSPSHLRAVFHMKFSALSTRLTWYEQRALIVREKPHASARSVHLYLTPKGHTLVQVYEDYMARFLKRVRKSLSIKETLSLRGTLETLKTMIYPSSKDQTNVREVSLSTAFFFDVFNYFTVLETRWFENKNIPFKQRELLILSELYQRCVLKNDTFISLASFFRIPYQTLMTTVRKYKQSGVLSETDQGLTLREDVEHIVEAYITLRTVIFYDTLERFQPNEQKVIFRLFALLKAHALEHLQDKAIEGDGS